MSVIQWRSIAKLSTPVLLEASWRRPRHCREIYESKDNTSSFETHPRPTQVGGLLFVGQESIREDGRLAGIRSDSRAVYGER
jgi:hypothetical protein